MTKSIIMKPQLRVDNFIFNQSVKRWKEFSVRGERGRWTGIDNNVMLYFLSQSNIEVKSTMTVQNSWLKCKFHCIFWSSGQISTCQGHFGVVFHGQSNGEVMFWDICPWRFQVPLQMSHFKWKFDKIWWKGKGFKNCVFFCICLSWGFQNTPYIFNLTKLWLSY